MKIILGRKLGMTQLFQSDGRALGVTVLEAGPVVVTQLRTKEKDGYEAVQVGFGFRKQKRISKSVRGHLKGLGDLRWLKEFKGGPGELKRGEQITVSAFQEGDKVKVSAISKGKGFQGVVKRHGFHGAPKTHGTKHAHREPGSIGSTWPQRVIKGMRMAGRMGGERITVKDLEIVKIDKEKNLLAVKGAVPGPRGALVEIRG